MIYIQVIGVIFILGYYFGRRSGKEYFTKYNELRNKLESEQKSSKNNQIREVLSNILGNSSLQQTDNQNLENQTVPVQNSAAQTLQPSEPQPVSPVVLEESANQTVVEISKPHTDFAIKNYLDNTSLLLYFGAFLFISSVGLFVAFGNVEGALRTASVAFVSLIMYGLGFYLWNTKKKLKQVGEAFIGIGMMAIPFVGITAYNNSLDQSNAGTIWIITSILAVVMYTVTILYLRTTFVSYLLIGSVVSLTQSFVGITEGPVYYFIWLLAITGIIMQFLSIVSRTISPLRDASSNSGQIFIPVALFASVLTSTTQGVGQLAMTTGLATLYYGLLAVTDKINRKSYIGLTHVLAIITTLLATFATTESFTYLSYVLIIISVIHILSLFSFKKYLSTDIIHQNIMLTSAMFIIVFSLVDYQPHIVVLGILTLFIISTIISFIFKYLYSLFLY